MTNPRTDADIDELVDSLTLEEQVAVLAGADFWHTIPHRTCRHSPRTGQRWPVGRTRHAGGRRPGVGQRAVWFVAGCHVGPPPLVEEVAHLLGREALATGARVLLAHIAASIPVS